MAPVPSSPLLTLAVHRGQNLISISEVATLEVGVEMAARLATGGRWCTVRDRRGILLFAQDSSGDYVSPDHGTASDLHRWNRRIP